MDVDVTVLLSTRNHAARLATWLNHFERQTYPAARFEVLVIDEGSQDGTAALLERYAVGAPMCLRYHLFESASPMQAYNHGIREAQGRWLLFLQDDLLPSPTWIAAHVALQEQHTGKTCVIGAVHAHPQLPAQALTRWFLPEVQQRLNPGESPHFLDWKIDNLSISRQTLLDIGGFDATCAFPPFADIELACRLSRQGIRAVFAAQANAYIWQPVCFKEEYLRQYQRGYALHQLSQQTGAQELFHRYHLRPPLWRKCIDALVMPFYMRTCEQEEEDIQHNGRMYRRVFRHQLAMGYKDALNGRPQRTFS